MVTLALSKGRILEESIPLLERAGIVPEEDLAKTRRLIVGTNVPDVRLVVIRAADVPTYVRYGAADLGIAGKDVLLEDGGEGLFELADLGIAVCRLMMAAPIDEASRGIARSWTRLRVATKYVRITERYLAAQGIQADIIHLYGSMELAPLVGLADCIVDLVSSGRTLAANGLKPVEHVLDVSAWLVANRAAMKMEYEALRPVITCLTKERGT